MEETYERLPDVVVVYGPQIEGLTAKLVVRTKNKAMYYRWDHCWEVFRVKIEKGKQIFDKSYPTREVYPGNEDFGKFAWAYNNEKEAMETYSRLPD